VTYLPSVEELERELERDRRIAEAIVQRPRAEKTAKGKRAARSKGQR
jgi:ribulose bisphosphate carboxylase small subunit